MVKRIISQSTGGSTGEDEEELSGTCLETKHNTHHNEFLDHELIEVSAVNSIYFLHMQNSQMHSLEKIRIKRPKLVLAHTLCYTFLYSQKLREKERFKFYILPTHILTYI